MMKHGLSSHIVTDNPFFSRGFTFVEVLAAMLFMAILVPIIVQGLVIANRAGVVAERKRIASQLADRMLADMMITGDWRNGEQEGDFGEEWPDYSFILETQAWDLDTMRMVTLQVLYHVQGKEYTVSLSTLAPEELEAQE
jgi:type II secretory pathway pseudopilin PulG